jgi:ADP-ribose pyrophosphatase YjhB (NUDIX family)
MIDFRREGRGFGVRVSGVAMHRGLVLLSRAEKDNFWSLPGGRCEMMEPSGNALRREMREELGCDVQVERLLWTAETLTAGNRGITTR